MSDANDDNDGRAPGSPGRGPLTLKPRPGGSVAAGTVRQSFSHGRSKTVVVETKRRRPDGSFGPAPTAPTPEKRSDAPQTPRPRQDAPRGGGQQGGLRAEELEARRRAIEGARAESERRDAERQAQARQEDAARRAAPAPAAPVAPEAAAPVVVAQAPQPAAASEPASAPAPAPAPVQAPTPHLQAPPMPRTEGRMPYPDRAPRPQGDRSQGDRPGGDRGPRPQGDRPGGYAGGDRGPRPQGDRPQSDRPQGDRPGYAGGGDRGPRPQGDRPGGYAGGGDRGPRPQGDRPQSDRPQGDRPGYAGGGDRGPRPQGDRPGGYAGGGDRGPRPQGDRPHSDRPQGDRSGYAGGGDRGPRPQGDRGPRPASGPGGETVRYSALSPRPASGAPRGDRPGGPRGAGGAGAPAAAITEPGKPRPAPKGDLRRSLDDDDGARGGVKRAGGPGAAPGKAVSRTKGEPKRREGRLTLHAVVGDDEGTADRMRSLASVRRAREREREKRKGGGSQEQVKAAREVVIPDIITVQELSNRMAVRAVDIIKFLMRQGMMLKINDVIDTDTAELVATDFGHTVRRVSESDVEEGFISADDDVADTAHRAPVVAVMGHVDHGKTSLLDALRQTDVAAGEAGGITQHIGAYQVRLESGEKVTFLDTPGHAAFSAMRARGAHVTDIVVLVVAADDGVMPQTIEAINHARAAGAPMIVAINKMDKPGADPTKVLQDLLQHEVVVEAFGGETQAIEVSALKKTGLDNLIEAILLQAEILDLRANPDRTAEGVVIEAKLDRGRGPVATILVKRGTLKRGDIVVAGSAWGRVRALINEREEQLLQAGPSEPVEVLGLDAAPEPGEPFAVVENEARAREITEYRERQRRDRLVAPIGAGVSLSDMMSKLQAKKTKELPILIKSDVQGSAEAIVGSLEKISTDEVRARVIHSAVGGINESDVLLAKSAGAPIIGFNVRASKQARELAEREGVEIRYYAIIYDLLDDIKGVLSGMLSPIQRETFLGNAEVIEAFDISKIGRVAGCKVIEGVVRRGAKVRIVRNDVVIQEMGVLNTLKRFKDDVNEVQSGQECGMSFLQFQDIKPGDQIECFTVEEIKRTL